VPSIADSALDELVELAILDQDWDKLGLGTASSYIGPDEPEFILVGDQRSDKHLGHRAAFTPYPGTSGEYLFRALNRALREDWPEHVGLLNAEPDLLALDEHLRLCLDRLEPTPRALALGRNASAALTAQGILHGTVPHPQFVRRFHQSSLTEYAELICSTLGTREDRGSWPTC
jgi:Fe-S cluster biosynthesis and repair protein YggX